MVFSRIMIRPTIRDVDSAIHSSRRGDSMTDSPAYEPNQNNGLNIDRCVCTDVTFREMKEWADAQIESNPKSCPTQHDVRAQFGCGTICGLCRPYIAKMLLTGDTEFSVIIPSANVSPEQDEP